MSAHSFERIGVLAAVASSALGGVAGGATRFVIEATDPVTLGVFRFGTGFLLLLPIALVLRSRWPSGKDWIAVVLLGLLFFFAFSVLFNLADSFTTAARGALALSTMPIMTMLVGAALGVEPLTRRKVTGVFIAFSGVTFALVSGLRTAPMRRGVASSSCSARYFVCRFSTSGRGPSSPAPIR